jgi:hypothetical protein
MIVLFAAYFDGPDALGALGTVLVAAILFLIINVAFLIAMTARIFDKRTLPKPSPLIVASVILSYFGRTAFHIFRPCVCCHCLPLGFSGDLRTGKSIYYYPSCVDTYRVLLGLVRGLASNSVASVEEAFGYAFVGVDAAVA